MHPFFMFWKRDDVDNVQEDSQPFQDNSNILEAMYYNDEFGPIKLYWKKKYGQPKSVYM